MKEILVWVPEKQLMFFMQEGSGCNLDQDDLEHGYDAYIDYTVSRLNDDYYFEEYDGGMFLYKDHELQTDDDKIKATICFVINEENCPNFNVMAVEEGSLQQEQDEIDLE